MIAKTMMLAVGTLILSAAAAAPASAGDRRVEVELGRGGIEVHADFRSDRDRRDNRRDDRGDYRRGGRRGDHIRVIPGHYETRLIRVWVPGYTREEYVPPVYETRTDRCGNCYRVLVREGYVRRIEVPGYYEVREERVWVPARVEYRR